MKRRIADVAVPGACQQDHNGFDPAGEPHGDTVAAAQAEAMQISGNGVDSLVQLMPRKPWSRVS